MARAWCVVVTALVGVILLSLSGAVWAEEETAEQLLQEKVERDRIIAEKRQAEARVHLEQGRSFVGAGRYQEALAELEQAVALAPTLEEAQQLLVRVRRELGLRPAEEQLLETLVRRDEVAREALRARVEELLRQAAQDREARRYDEAQEKLATAANLVRYSLFRQELASLEEEADNEARAVGRARERYQVSLERERRQEALRSSARRKVEAQAELAATEKELLSQAQKLYQGRDYVGAARLAQVVTNVNPDNTEAHILFGQAERLASREQFLALGEERAREFRTQWEETEASTLPRGERELMVYPEDWRELSQRRKAVAAVTFGPPREPWRDRLEEQLRRQVSFEFTEAPLSQVVEFLGSLSEANIILDRRGIQTAGKDPEMPITLKIKNVTLADALNWIKDLTGLTYTLHKGAILISDPSQMPKEEYLATYDVRDLLASVPDFVGPEFDLEAGTTGEGGGGGFQTEEGGGAGGQGISQFVPTQMSGEDLVQFIIDALGLE